MSCSGRRRPATRRASFALRRLPALIAALVASLAASAALAFEPFVVKDIRVEGVQRTEAGTVFSYLPIKVGDRIDDERAAQAVKALFATGFFRDVRLEADGDVLVVIVQERPTISNITESHETCDCLVEQTRFAPSLILAHASGEQRR